MSIVWPSANILIEKFEVIANTGTIRARIFRPWGNSCKLETNIYEKAVINSINNNEWYRIIWQNTSRLNRLTNENLDRRFVTLFTDCKLVPGGRKNLLPKCPWRTFQFHFPFLNHIANLSPLRSKCSGFNWHRNE